MIVNARRSAQSETLRGEVGSVTTHLLYYITVNGAGCISEFNSRSVPSVRRVSGFIFGVIKASRAGKRGRSERIRVSGRTISTAPRQHGEQVRFAVAFGGCVR
jgi:hypothetical protein